MALVRPHYRTNLAHSVAADPYGLYHTVQAYQTVDFVTFENLGVALPIQNRLAGTEFR